MDKVRIQFQRDFYHLLLKLGNEEDLRDILKEALQLIAGITDADQGYLEVRDENNHCVYQSFSVTDDEIANLQKTISSGIIAEVIRTRESVLIPSALFDPRFDTLESVQRLNIESVLCVPFFGDHTQGILYLQGDPNFKSNVEKIRLDAELFALHVSPLLDQLLKQHERLEDSNLMANLHREYRLEDIIGRSDKFAELLKSAMMISTLEVTTLLLGETGTGKTQLAELIHKNSNRKDAPFVEINCASLPESLAENELFGSAPGGHSTATRAVKGKITAADGGTLFLDEIGELALGTQAKLLTFIQSGNYYPLGSAEVHSSDVRLILATNTNLQEKIANQTFREDLYYRIHAFELVLPSLRDRQQDIVLLAEHIIDDCCKKHRFATMRMLPEAEHSLIQYSWPGNIRELQSVVERACIYAQLKQGSEITAFDLPDETSNEDHDETLYEELETHDFHTATHQFQRRLLEKSLLETNWNISQTARDLNLSRSQANNLINSFGLLRKVK